MRPRNHILPVLVMVALIAVIAYSHRNDRQPPPAGMAAPSGDPPPAAATAGWTRLVAPHLVEWAGNDGDSFRFRHREGTGTYRLYFVDTPEKNQSFPDRLYHQSRYFGGIGTDRVIAAGEAARDFTLALLRGEPVEVWTRGERVMDSDRVHALVRFPRRSNRWLHEELVLAGLARIYTMPTDLPDGTPKQTHLRHLRALEAEARAGQRGAWAKR